MASDSSVIFGAYIAYAVVTIALLWRGGGSRLALVLLIAGWMFLPVERYRADVITLPSLMVDVVGIALPGVVMVSKGWVAPVAVLVGLLPSFWSRLQTIRPLASDLAMAAFCCSPVLPLLGGQIGPYSAFLQFSYLCGVWGATWVVGRTLLSDLAGRRALSDTLAWSGLALLPIAIVEGLVPPRLYNVVYGAHPFQLTGSGRYAGYRPVGFFEDGNQYGIWIALAALAAVHRCFAVEVRRRSDLVLAGVLTFAALASQSVGAILLLAAGCAWLVLSRNMRHLLASAVAALLVLGGGAYLSGQVPLERWAVSTAQGQRVMGMLRSVDRASLAFRVRRDQLALPLIAQAPWTGFGRWDWWRPMKSRPWGLPLLVAGQYGIFSVLTLAWALLSGAGRRLIRAQPNILAMVTVLAACDAWLNSFIYLPAILCAAALAVPAPRQGGKSGEGAPKPAPSGPGHANSEMHND